MKTQAILILTTCIVRAAEPAIDKPVQFHTAQADAIVSAMQVFPPNNPWNTAVDQWPVAANSQAIIAGIGGSKPLRYNQDMGFTIVPAAQKKIPVKITAYADESDKGPFPVPANAVIEGWPATTGKLTLDQVQRGLPDINADRHGIIVDPMARRLYEFYRLTKTDTGWTAEQASIFDLSSNALRPAGWTSSDAAGLPIFPAVVRHDELQRGKITHALRVTIRNTRRAYVYPATHFASTKTDPKLPRMGERFRLRRGFNTTSFTPEARTILEALKRYGMLVADNGIDLAVSITPDPRIPDMNEELRRVKAADFEVVNPPPGYKPPK